MKSKTSAIILGHIRYKETSIIAKAYTEQFGLRSYIVNSVRSYKNKNKIALFQPLTQLDMVVYEAGPDKINRIAEAALLLPGLSGRSPEKSALLLFLADVLSKIIKEAEADPPLYGFLQNSLILLDGMETGYENFHLQFLLKLTRFLGFFPETGKEIGTQLNIVLPPQAEEALCFLLDGAYSDRMPAGRDLRAYLLETLLAYYRLHIEGMAEIKSLRVLKEVFDVP